jgi:hypothetical protein
VPALLAEAVDRALQRDLGQRHSSMRALALALVKAGVAHEISLPENPDPIGLPDYPSWRSAAHRAPSPLANTTSELVSEPWPALATPSAPTVGSGPRATPASGRWKSFTALAVLLALMFGAWLYDRSRETAPAVVAPISPGRPPSLPAAELPKLIPPTVTELKTVPAAPASLDRQVKEEPVDSARKSSSEHGRRKPRNGSSNPRAEPTASERKPGAQGAEVETEWK